MENNIFNYILDERDYGDQYHNDPDKEIIISYDALWDSFMKCKRGVNWKVNVKRFNNNAVKEILKMERDLHEGTWENSKPKKILITYPKRREGLSIPFRDRVYQRSINDNVLYKSIQPSFILDNCACQKGKGLTFARKRLKKHLWNQYCHHGIDSYVLQIDIKSYYPNMQHWAVRRKFRRYLNDTHYQMVCDILETQNIDDDNTEVGYFPGSQMIQIAGISLLDDLDHYCKEKLHLKHYMRYMDDILIIHEDKEYLEYCLKEIERVLDEISFRVHETKTHIRPLKKGFTFLGFDYRMTFTGKVIMTLNSPNIKHERKKLYRMVRKYKKGLLSKEKIEECFHSWCANAEKGNSHNLILRMTEYYNDLMEEIESEETENGESRETGDVSV